MNEASGQAQKVMHCCLFDVVSIFLFFSTYFKVLYINTLRVIRPGHVSFRMPPPLSIFHAFLERGPYIQDKII